MNWLIISLNWWFYLFLIGIIFFPFTTLIFRKFNFDFGYPFAKTLGILFLSYFIFTLGSLKIVQFNQLAIFFILLILTLINFYIFYKKKVRDYFSVFPKIFFEETLFLISFIFWTYIRGQEPSIRSLEKFMDFGFINSILRSKFFPPTDIWYPPEPINYYYFGHLTAAVLIKLTNFLPAIGYNLILSTIFALGITQVFSLSANLINFYLFSKEKNLKEKSPLIIILFSLITAFIVNLGGNLHTIYIFTKGYPNENPIPFWQIFSFCNSIFPAICQKLGIQLQPYWYPNATRFIPYTIHEFPSYSYVVADLHGHVFDIPFVVLSLAIIFILFLNVIQKNTKAKSKYSKYDLRYWLNLLNYDINYLLLILLGFLTAVHYMTNAFDGPIYILLTIVTIFFLFGFSQSSFLYFIIYILFFFISTLPFSLNFKPFVSGIGVNCGAEIFNFSGKIGPFLFEKNNCQSSPFWMLFLLWGFFWVNFLFLILTIKNKKLLSNQAPVANYLFILFSFGSFLILIPELFYIKDIYPAHFRANTMFKLGYQAFIMMGVASGIVFFLIKHYQKNFFIFIYLLLFIFILIYPFFAIPSYYGDLKKNPQIDGSMWLQDFYPQDKEIVDWLNKNVKNQPIILEAQGDSYTDYERISALTGLPTVAGWWVHEWLWRGSADFIGKRIPDVVNIYESDDLELTKRLLKKYTVKYVIISQLEKQKYPNLKEEKFLQLGKIVFKSSNNLGVIYQLNSN